MVKYNQKFSIRKVSVGAASVVIGLTAGSAVSQAADVENNTSVSEVRTLEKNELEISIPVPKNSNEDYTSSRKEEFEVTTKPNEEATTHIFRNISFKNTDIKKDETSNKEISSDENESTEKITLDDTKNNLRTKVYNLRYYDSSHYINKIDEAKTNNELNKLEFDIDKLIFKNNLDREYSRLSATYKEKLEKILTREELEQLQKSYEAEKLIENERNKISHYISRNLTEIDREEYEKKLNNARTIAEIQNIKDEAKKNNQVLLNNRIEREKLNINNIMDYIEPLTTDQKEYIKEGVTERYKKEYEEKTKIEEDNNRPTPPDANTIRPDSRQRYALNNTRIENFFLNKIHALHILNSGHPHFTKNDFAELHDEILKNSDFNKNYDMFIRTFEETKRLNRLEQDEKEILKNSILNELYLSPSYNEFRNNREDFINSLDDNKFLSRDEIKNYRKKLFSGEDSSEITNLVQNRELNELLKNSNQQDKEKLQNLAKIDSEATLKYAKELSKIDSYKNLTNEDKQFFKVRVAYPTSYYGGYLMLPKPAYPDGDNIDILDKLYTLDIPQEDKKRLKSLIYQAEILNRRIVDMSDLKDYETYYKNKKRIDNPNFSTETKNTLLSKLEKIKENIDTYLNEKESNAKKNEKAGYTSKSLNPNIIETKIIALEKLFNYSYIPQIKKLQYEKEIVENNNYQEVNNLMAMHRALNEMLEIQKTLIPTSALSPNKPTEENKMTEQKNPTITPKKPVIENTSVATTVNPTSPMQQTEINPTATKKETELTMVSKKLGNRKVEVAYDKNKIDIDNLYFEKIDNKIISKIINSKLGNDYKILEAFEIHFEKNGVKVKSNVLNTVGISLVVNNDTVEVYNVKENNDLEKIPSQVIDDKIYFTTNHFSTFTLIKRKTKLNQENQEQTNVVYGIEYTNTNLQQKGKKLAKEIKETISKKELAKTGLEENSLANISALTLLAVGFLLNKRKKN